MPWWGMSFLTRSTKTCGPHAIIIFVVVSCTIIYIFLPIILLVIQEKKSELFSESGLWRHMYFLLLFICLFLFIFNVTFDFQNKSVKYNFPQIHLASIQQKRMAMKITMRSSLDVLAGSTVEMYPPASGHAGQCLFF